MTHNYVLRKMREPSILTSIYGEIPTPALSTQYKRMSSQSKRTLKYPVVRLPDGRVGYILSDTVSKRKFGIYYDKEEGLKALAKLKESNEFPSQGLNSSYKPRKVKGYFYFKRRGFDDDGNSVI